MIIDNGIKDKERLDFNVYDPALRRMRWPMLIPSTAIPIADKMTLLAELWTRAERTSASRRNTEQQSMES